MNRQFKKRRMIPVALALMAVVVLSGVAYAYWTAGGSGTGTGTAAGGVSNLTVNQITVLKDMYPGDTAQTISGNFDNPGPNPVYVTSVTVSIASVTAAGTCAASDFTLLNPVAPVGAEVLVGNGVGAWTGPTIQFNDKPATNQDGCKGATVHLAYVVS